MSRGSKIAVWAGGVFASLLILAFAAILFVTQTQWGRDQIRRIALEQLDAATDGEVRIGRLQLGLDRRLRLIDISITDPDDRPFVVADTLATRFTLLGLLRQRIELTDVLLVNANVVLDRPPGEDWNFARIFRIEPDPAPEPVRPGWGDYVVLRDVHLVRTNVEVRTEWEPEEGLTPAERERAIDQALSGETRANVQRVPNGFQTVMQFRFTDARVPRARVAHPDEDEMVFEIGSLQGVLEPFLPPAAEVRDLAGRVTISSDSLYFEDVAALFPDSRITGLGVYDLRSAKYHLDLQGDPVELADLRWLYPPLPEEGGGRLHLTMESREFTTAFTVDDVDLRVGESGLTGRLSMIVGDTVRFGETNLGFDQFDTRLVDRILPDVDLPIDGKISGTAALLGPPEAMQVDVNVAFADRMEGVSHVSAVGGIGMGEKLRFADLYLRLDPLRVELIRREAPQLPLPPGGTVTGELRLDGLLAELLHVDGALAHRHPATGLSRMTARGGVQLREELVLRDLFVRLEPLQTELIRPEVPALPPASTIAGQIRLTGPVSRAVQLAGDLTLRDPATGASRVVATGGITLEDELRFQALQLRLDPLHVDLLRRQVPTLPPGILARGPIRLDGSPSARLAMDGELELLDPRTGINRIAVRGGVQVAEPLTFHNLDIRLDPLRVAFVRPFAPELPLDGLLEGAISLDGAPEGRLRVSGDLTHVERGDRSRVAGEAEIVRGARAAVDVQLLPLSLETVGRLAPEAGLHGWAAGRVVAFGDLGDLHLRADLRVPDDGALSLDGRLDLRSDQPRYDLRTHLDGLNIAAITRRAPAVTELTGELDATGRGVEPATMIAEFRADLVGPRVDDVELDTVWVHGAIDRGLARVEPSVVRLGTAEVTLHGSFGLVEGRLGELAYRIDVDSLQPFAAYPADPDTIIAPAAPSVDAALAEGEEEVVFEPVTVVEPLAGSLQAEGILRGNVERFDLVGSASVENLTFQGNFVGSGAAEHTILGFGTDQPDFELDAELARIHAQGLDFDSATIRVEHRGMRFGAGRATLVAFQNDATDVRADLQFDLALEHNEIRLNDLALRFDTITWRAEHPSLVTWGPGEVRVDSLDLRSAPRGRIFLDGTLPIEGAADMQFVIEDLPLAHVAALLQEDAEVTGILSLEANVEGTLASPAFAGEAALVGASHDRREIPDTRAEFSYADRELAFETRFARGALPLGKADGRIPLDLALADREGPRLLDAPLTVEILADSIPLDALPLITDQVKDVRGRIAGTVSVTGTPQDPALDGVVDLDRAALRIVANGVRYDDVRGTLRLEGRTVIVDSLVAWNGGPVRVTGEVDLAALDRPVLDLHLTGQEAQILDNEHGRLWVDADLEIQGPFDGIEIAGRVNTHRGVVYIPEARDPRIVNLDDPESFERIDPDLITELEALVQPSPLLENLRLEVELFVGPETWVRSTEANVEVYTEPEIGPLTVQYDGTNGELSIEGTINTDRGEYEFLGRRFEITRGAATFLGRGEFDPLIQVAAQHSVRMAGREPLEIRIVLQGTALSPSIALESNARPPLPQTDLLSFLAFGRTTSSLLQQQGSSLTGQGAGTGDLVGNVAGLASQQLGAVAANVLLQEFERDLARSLGLDVFHITPADLPAELFTGRFEDLLRGTRIEAGAYIGRRLFAAGEARPTFETRPGARLEYRAPNGYRIITSWQPRFLTPIPTLRVIEPDRTSVFGAFLRREWRF